MPTKTRQPVATTPAEKLNALHARKRELLTQQRQALLDQQNAEREHQHLDHAIQVAHDRALALGENAPTEQDATQLTNAAEKLDHATQQVEQLERIIDVINEEIRAVRRDNADELVGEQLVIHADAAERIEQLIGQLHDEIETARRCYVEAQTILAAAGRNTTTARLRVTPSIEAVIRAGGLEPLLDEHDARAAA
jgi:hypothetical protein